MIKAEIVAHSINKQGDELISVLCTFPRIILAEVNTHRMLSKNTSSSRAIPYIKMVKSVMDNPFIPIAFQKKHSGMQGTEYLDPNKKYIWGDFYEYLHEQFKKAFYDEENEKWEEEYDEFQQLFNNYVIPIFTHKHEGYTHVEWWLKTRDLVVSASLMLYGMGVTKQLCNRLLEPFMWTTMLITGSKEGWDNFFNLRCPQYQDIYTKNKYYKSWKTYLQHIEDYQTLDYAKNLDVIGKLRENKGQAEIHIMDLAEKIYDAMNESTPEQLKVRGWHIPFAAEITDLYIKNKGYIPETEIPIDEFVKISTAMAAHTSYTIVGGEAVKSYEKWIDLHDKLIAYDPPHSSPMEHCARAMNDYEYQSFVKGNLLPIDMETNWRGDINTEGWCYNLKGFIPYRYMIDNKINLNGK
jgi:thymidylate synthase ThyX